MSSRYWLLLSLVVLLNGCGAAGSPEQEAATSGPPDLLVLDSAQVAAAGIVFGVVEPLPADTIQLTGTVTFDAAQVSHVSPRTQGRLRRVNVDIGQPVTSGDTLAVLDSPELGAAQARWVKARVGRDVAQRNYDRTERLAGDGIVSQRRRLEVEADFRDREAELNAAMQALSVLGADPDPAATGYFVLRSPLSGEVVEKHATIGEVVGPEAMLFVVGELNRVWLLLDLYEIDLTRVRVGAPAVVIADAYPDQRFRARLALVSSVVDTISRTIKLRLEIPNPDHLLKPGMFARAALAVDSRPGAIGIPHVAVQRVGDRDVVFISDSTGRFRVQPVTVGSPRAGGWVELHSGLKAGDSLVIGGSFSLTAQLLRATFGQGGH